MAVYLHETTVTERDFVSGENGPFDLPVNPTSFLLIHLRAVAGATAPDLEQLLGHISAVVVSFKGTSIVAVSGPDLARLVHHVWGKRVNIEGFNAVNPALVSVTLPVPFTRKPFWPREAFPATRRGEWTLSIVRTASLTNISSPKISVESVQLLEAEPAQFLKMVTLQRNVAPGDLDIELPIGNPLLGLQIFSPTAMGNDPISETIRRFRLLVDGVEYNVANASFDTMRAVGQLRGADWDRFVAVPSAGRHYCYVDFDPLMDESYVVETEGRASVKLRVESDVSGVVRVVPVELVRVAAPAA